MAIEAWVLDGVAPGWRGYATACPCGAEGDERAGATAQHQESHLTRLAATVRFEPSRVGCRGQCDRTRSPWGAEDAPIRRRLSGHRARWFHARSRPRAADLARVVGRPADVRGRRGDAEEDPSRCDRRMARCQRSIESRWGPRPCA